MDLEGKMAGRGAYLCHSIDCWEQGMKRNRLEHALRIPMTPEDRQRLQEYANSVPLHA